MHLQIRTVVFALSLPIALTLAGAALGEAPGGRHRERGKHRDHAADRFIEQHAEELGLSPETREEIAKIAEGSRARAEELRAASGAGREAMHELLRQPLPDEDAVMALSDEISARRAEAKKNRLGAMLAIRKLLTEEQRAKLVEIRKVKRSERTERTERSEQSDRRPGKGRRACREDVAEMCPEAKPGQSTLQCMVERWQDLSEECRASFEERGRRWPRRGWREDPPID
jgi:Spy/CpxP family protein refolding chaperone